MTSIKNGLLVSATQGSGSVDGYKNMGDYIQSIAPLAFFDNIDDIYVDKEKISHYRSLAGKTRLVMNAWLMKYPENWPPSNDIIPLLISVHISPQNASKLLSKAGIDYLKQHGPVGCRDTATLELLEKYEIPCYFSGCLTLTLGEKYKSEKTNDDVVFVDPYCEAHRNSEGKISARVVVQNILYGLKNLRKVKKIMPIFEHAYCLAGKYVRLKKFLTVSAFYRTYSSKFDDNILFNASYVTHSLKIGKGTPYDTEALKLNYTENLIKRYAEASLVVTSRIHCALPCLGIETPAIFVHAKAPGHVRAPGRFGGLYELFNVMLCSGYTLSSEESSLSGRIEFKTKLRNKEDYKPLRDNMIKRCKEFIALDIKSSDNDEQLNDVESDGVV